VSREYYAIKLRTRLDHEICHAELLVLVGEGWYYC
jgi:hypothetical protein